jgi:rubrerythrin
MAGKSLKNTKSLDNLKEAFAGESQANRRYLYFARVADIEGFPDIAGLFKDTADAKTGHAPSGTSTSSRKWAIWAIRPPASPWARRSSI